MRARFAAKLTIVFGLSTLCVTTFAIGWFYRQAQSAVHREIQAKLIDVALTSANWSIRPTMFLFAVRKTP